jgi:hypothetical protein
MEGGYTIIFRASPWYLAAVDAESPATIEIAAADAAAADEVVAELLDAFPGEPVGDETDCLIEVVGPGGERVVRVPS